LNIHFHTLLFDGVFYAPGEGDTLDFRALLARIAARMQRLLERRSLDSGGADLCQADPVVEESPALAGISSASIQGRIALGPRAGEKGCSVKRAFIPSMLSNASGSTSRRSASSC